MIGTSVDRYEILEELGHGGMSVVYRGLDSSLEREVAVKVLHNHLAKKLENRRRFHREAKAIARLRHPNILEIYDYSAEDAERSYIVMEYVAGENLRQFLARTGTPPPEVAAMIAIEICNALEHAHDHGIIHRDLKPENVMVSNAGDLKLMDFGIAHVIDAETMTATGSLMGSPAHMAPELIDGEKVGVRADVFALGTVLFWLSTGSLPFDGANAPQVLKRVLAGDFDDPELVEPRVGKRLGDIIRRCLAHDPQNRYESVVAARKVLETFVASAGVVEIDHELKKYFKAPDAYREEFDETIVEKLMVLARQARRERDVPRAIGLFNRILAYDPDNSEVQRQLDKLCRQAQWRQAAPWVAGVALALAAVGGWFFTRPPAPPPADEPTEEVVVTPPPEPGTVAAVAERVAESANEASEAMRVADERGALLAAHFERRATEISSAVEETRPTAVLLRPTTTVSALSPKTEEPEPDVGVADVGEPEPPATFKYRFKVIPAAASLLIDGNPVDAVKASAGVELTEGRHVLRADSRGTKPWTDTLFVRGPQEDPKRIVLEWEDGRVHVVSNTKSVVWFDGSRKFRQIGANGRDAMFTVDFGDADSTEPKKQINLRVASADYINKPKDYTVTVQPGGTQTVNVSFEPQPP